MIKYRDKRFEIFPQVYPPSDDSFLLVDNMIIKKDDKVLDMGTGCGILGIFASDFGKVVACDVNPMAIEYARYNAELNSARMKVIYSDLFDNIGGKFDLILLNPPYLIPNPKDREDYLRMAWEGGKNGREVIDRFIDSAHKFLNKKGCVQIVQSSLNGIEKTLRRFKEIDLRPEVTAEERHFFEALYVVTACKD